MFYLRLINRKCAKYTTTYQGNTVCGRICDGDPLYRAVCRCPNITRLSSQPQEQWVKSIQVSSDLTYYSPNRQLIIIVGLTRHHHTLILLDINGVVSPVLCVVNWRIRKTGMRQPIAGEGAVAKHPVFSQISSENISENILRKYLRWVNVEYNSMSNQMADHQCEQKMLKPDIVPIIIPSMDPATIVERPINYCVSRNIVAPRISQYSWTRFLRETCWSGV